MKPKCLFGIDNSDKSHGRLLVVGIEQAVRLMFLVYNDLGLGRSADASQLLLSNIGDQIAVRIDLHYSSRILLITNASRPLRFEFWLQAARTAMFFD